MSLEASGLEVVVKSTGIAGATDALNKLAVAGDKAEKSTAKLAKANSGVEAAAKKQEKVWYDLVAAVSRAKEKEYNTLQRHNNKLYGLAQAEANRMNKQMDRITQQDAANFAKRRAAEQKQLEALDQLRHKAASKEYARAQAEGNRLNALLDRQRKQQEAAAKASVERQRVQNATYAASSLAQQIATLQKAQAYAAQGGNVSTRYGSNVSGALAAGELARLRAQYKQLGEEARRTNSIMADSHAAIRGLSGSLGALWLTYGNLLPLMIGAGIGAGLKEAVTGFANVEYQMTFVKALTEDTTRSVKELTAELHNVALSLGINPEEAAKGLRALAQAGLNTKDALSSLAMVFKVSTVGELPLETAALALTGVANAYGMVTKDLEHIGDVMTKAGAMSATSVSAMSESMKYAAGTAEQYGVELEKLGTILTLLGKRTITGSSAGVAANNLIAEIYSPSSFKAIKAQAALGVQTYANGVRVEIDKVISQMKTNLGKFDAQSQGKILEDWFGKKGGRGFYAVAQANADEFMKIEEDLRNSTGFTAKVFEESLTTMRGQMMLTSGTISNTFATIGEGTAEPIKDLLRGVRAVFADDALKDALVGFTQSIVTMVQVVGPLAIAYGGLWAAMKVGHIVVPALVKAFALLNFASLSAGMLAAKTAFTGLVTAITTMNVAALAANPILIAIVGTVTLLAGAYFLLKRDKESALSMHEREMQNSLDTQKHLKDEIELIRQKTNLQRQGVDESEWEAKIRQNQGQKEMLSIQSEIAANEKRMKEAAGRKVGGSNAQLSVWQAEIAGYKMQDKALNDALKEKRRIYDENKKLDDQLSQDRRNFYEEQRLLREGDILAQEGQGTGPGGTQVYGAITDGDTKKIAKFHQAEALELNKLIAGYEAKNAAMRQSIELGKHVAAEAQQAIVLENLLAGKYGSKSKDNALYQAQMRLAMMADEAKAENERLKKVNEFATKLAELEAAQKAYNAEAVEGSMTHFGALRKEAEGLIAVTSMSDQAAEALRKRADAADAYKKSQEAIIKLNSAADSSRNRAEEAKEEAEMMRKYGENTKLGAMAVAELVIQKSKLDDVTGNVAKSALREAAATEQLNTAYRDLAKQQIDLSKAVEDAQAESKLIFANSEAEKVKIANETRKKLLDIEIQKVQDAYAAKKMAGTSTPQDYQIMMESYKVYLGNIEKSEQLSIQETSNLRSKGWKKSLDDIESIAREGFFNLSEKGVSIWSSMTSTFKNMFKTTVMEYIYKEFAKPLVLKVVASLAGIVGADGLAQAAGAISGNDTSSGGIGSLIGNVKNAYSVLTNGFAGIADSVAGGVQSVMSVFGYNPSAAQGLATAGGKAITPFAQGAGALASYAGGALAGVGLGRTISGGYSALGGSGNTAVNVGTAVGAFMGPLGAAIGGAVGGLVNRAFGRGPKEVTAQGIRGTLSSDGTTGESYSNWMQKGGWFRSDKKGTDITALTDDVRNSFVSGLDSLKGTSSAFAQNLGISSDALKNYSKTFDITLTEDAAANQEAITKFFVEVGDDIATKLVPNIMEFAKQGESASVVLERLSNTFAATKNLADILGKSVTQLFGSDGIESANARTKLVDLSGGADALNSKASAYVNSIYTDAEKLAPVQKALAEAMNELGVSSITTKAQFKAYVETLNLTDEAQIKLFNNLLELAPAFAQVADAAEAAADAAKEAAEKLAEANKLAMEKAFDAAGTALDRLSTAIDAEKDNIDAKYDMVIDKVKAAAEASVEAAEKQREAAEKQRDAIKGVLDNITNALGSTVVESQELTRARRAEAQSYLAVSAIQARAGGSVSNMGGLNNALEMIAKPSEDLFSSFEAYARDQAMANFNLKSLQGSAQQELSAAELTIGRLNATIESIELASENQISALEKAREEEKAGLDNILNKAQQQLDALNGIDNSVMGVIAALNNFNASMAAVTATQIQQQQGTGAAIDSLYKSLLGRGADAGGKDYWTNAVNGGKSVVDISNGIKGSAEYQGKTIEDFYKSILGRNADTAGLAYWKERAAGGISLSEIEKTFRSSPEALDKMGIPSYAVGTDYVPQDGLAMIHKGEMIVPATDAADIRRARTQSEASSEVGGLKAAIKELQQTVMAGDISKIQVDKELLRLLKKWDQEGQPEIRDVELENVA